MKRLGGELGGEEEDESAYIAVEELLEIWARIRTAI
jgi:hypothetical protein